MVVHYVRTIFMLFYNALGAAIAVVVHAPCDVDFVVLDAVYISFTGGDQIMIQGALMKIAKVPAVTAKKCRDSIALDAQYIFLLYLVENFRTALAVNYCAMLVSADQFNLLFDDVQSRNLKALAAVVASNMLFRSLTRQQADLPAFI